MELRREANGVVVATPAKLNLFFEILARRADGYHEIETLMAPLALFDTLVFRDLGPLQSDGEAVVAMDCEWAAGLRKGLTVCGNDGRADDATFGVGTAGIERSDLEELPTGNDNIAVRAIELLRRRAE